MVINFSMVEARYVAELVEADAKTNIGNKEAKLALLKKLSATIEYHEAKQKKGKP